MFFTLYSAPSPFFSSIAFVSFGVSGRDGGEVEILIFGFGAGEIKRGRAWTASRAEQAVGE